MDGNGDELFSDELYNLKFIEMEQWKVEAVGGDELGRLFWSFIARWRYNFEVILLFFFQFNVVFLWHWKFVAKILLIASKPPSPSPLSTTAFDSYVVLSNKFN
jgi:hypothetical protein